MARDRRSSKPEFQLERLQKKHATLEAKVEELSSQSFLTVDEHMEQRRLKKRKLAMKDEIRRYARL